MALHSRGPHYTDPYEPTKQTIAAVMALTGKKVNFSRAAGPIQDANKLPWRRFLPKQSRCQHLLNFSGTRSGRPTRRSPCQSWRKWCRLQVLEFSIRAKEPKPQISSPYHTSCVSKYCLIASTSASSYSISSTLVLMSAARRCKIGPPY